jgi:16S rRNA (guanine966-N2)-methyltransferase
MRIIAGRLRGRTIALPRGSAVRPSLDRVREAVFNVLAHGVDWPGFAGAHVVDLFAGSGIAGFEALSRGARRCTFVDDQTAALAAIRDNAVRFGEAGNITLLRVDASRLAPPPVSAEAPCDLVLLDPPYRSGLAEPALGALIRHRWIAAGAIAVVEVAAREEFLPPAPFAVLGERQYGPARVVFLRVSGNEPATS